MAIGIAWFCLIAAIAVVVLALIAMFVADDDWMMIPSLVLCGVLFVVGCCSWAVGELNDPHKGIITEKRFEPEHIVCGKTCFPVDDKWYFDLDDDGNKGDREVSHRTYDSLNVGDYYTPKD